jgi:hypothetical protein
MSSWSLTQDEINLLKAKGGWLMQNGQRCRRHIHMSHHSLKLKRVITLLLVV